MTSAGVPPSDANDSAPPPEDPPVASVFDFLYHDARRVGSFLAQFSTYGVLSGVTTTEAVGRAATTRATGGAGVGFVTVAKARVALELGVTDDERDAAERTFDPLWTNARTLLDYLAARDLIQRDVHAARLGQFVLATGSLIVLDVTMLKTAWDKPTVKRRILQGAEGNTLPAKPKGKGRHGPQSQEKLDAQLLIELLTVFPHSIQAHLIGDDFSAWYSLAESSLVGMSSDLVLKHGALVPGEWNVLGIMDARPDPRDPADDDEAGLTAFDLAVADSAGTAIGNVAARIAPIARQLLGRPRQSYGMTPLLIFREVSG